MDKFLEIYNLPTLNQEEIDNLKRPVISSEIEFVFNQIKKKFPANKSTVRQQHRGILPNI